MPSPSSSADRSRITKPTSMAGGPVYGYRGAVISSNDRGTVFSFKLEGFPTAIRATGAGLGISTWWWGIGRLMDCGRNDGAGAV